MQFLPWLLGSVAPRPNDDVRAAYVGLSLQHDRRHAVRATLEGVALNLAWLLPVALLVAMRRLDGAVGTLVAYAPLVWLAYRYKAGDRAAQAA